MDNEYRKLVTEALEEIEKLRTQLKDQEQQKKEPIAIIGMGCRFPGHTNSLDDYWSLLREGRSGIIELDKQRWDMDAYYDPDPAAPGKFYTRAMGILDDIDLFDADLFGIAPIEAVSMDPQHRIVLHTVWQAIEQAGYAPEKLRGTKTGVYLGFASNDYAGMQSAVGHIEAVSPYDGTGNAGSVAAGRISYLFGLHGPSIAIDTACSSSLVALNLACQSLRNRESDMAITGGVGLILSPISSIVFAKAGMLSEDGLCRTFDQEANGYVRAEGCGMIMLKRLSDAEKDGDNILALIRGVAVNQDGRSQGLTAPNTVAQEQVILEALKNGGVAPEQISYVEAHGTATSLGDPIEVEALGTVYKDSHSDEKPLLIGSVKTNIGHMETAAGIGGLIKVVLSLQNKYLPGQINFTDPNPHIEWSKYPLKVHAQSSVWKGYGEGKNNLFAGVSSFGFGGTNGHTILQNAQPVKTPIIENDRPIHIVNLSAKKPNALKQLAERYRDFIQQKKHEQIPLADFAYTTNIGRNHFLNRSSIIASNYEQLTSSLDDLINDKINETTFSAKAPNQSKKVAFFFSGQGSQYVGMGQQLYETQPSFRKAMDQCGQYLAPHLDVPLFSILWGEESHRLSETQYTQPALFALEYSLARLWRSWGITPARMLGHSVGEYAAACIAGVFSLKNACLLIAARGRLMHEFTETGSMISVRCSADSAKKIISGSLAVHQEKVSIAAINGPQSCVLSGCSKTLAELISSFEAQAIKTHPLEVSHGFHSPLMQPMLEPFRKVAQSIQYQKPRLRIVSTCTGKTAGADIATPEYWVNHITQPVLFCQAADELNNQLRLGGVIEIGPNTTLLGMSAGFINEDLAWAPSLKKGSDDWNTLLTSVAQLHLKGMSVDWNKFESDYPRRRASIPTYPFQSKSFWLDHIPLGKSHLDQSNTRLDWLYQQDWIETAVESPNGDPLNRQKWLVLSSNQALAKDTRQALGAAGADLYKVIFADQWISNGIQNISLDPSNDDHIRRLFSELGKTRFDGILFFADDEGVIPDAHDSAEQILSKQKKTTGALLSIVQRCSETGGQAPRLWVCNDNSANNPLLALYQSPVLGLAKVIASEFPELKCSRIEVIGDLESEKLLEEFSGEIFEDQIRYHQGTRTVARLADVNPQLISGQEAKITADKSYLITGGLGGLGLHFAQWMAERGATSLILAGRSGIKTPEQQQALHALKELGVTVEIAPLDISDGPAVESLIQSIQASKAPLGGVLHAAGVLDDGIISKQEWSRFENVMRPKMLGAWNLHQSTETLDLDFFILFSSVTSLLGVPGQSNYCAANAFLDAFAHYREQLNLPIMTINWGAWENLGMNNDAVAQRMSRNSGMGAIPTSQGLAIFEQLLPLTLPNVAVIPITWNLVAGMVAMVGVTPPLLIDQLKLKGGDVFDSLNLSNDDLLAGGELLELLDGALETERSKIIFKFVGDSTKMIMRLSEDDEIEDHQPLHEVGLDSLMAVEIRNVLARGISQALPVSLLFDYPSLHAIAGHLETVIDEGQNEDPASEENINSIDVQEFADPESEIESNEAESNASDASNPETNSADVINTNNIDSISAINVALSEGDVLTNQTDNNPAVHRDLGSQATPVGQSRAESPLPTSRSNTSSTHSTVVNMPKSTPANANTSTSSNTSTTSTNSNTTNTSTNSNTTNTTNTYTDEPIAIIGMGCRYPGHSNSPEEFWSFLKSGIDGVEDLGDKRWSLDDFYDPDPAALGKVYSRWGGLIDNVDQFDNEFFGIAPVEATSMDPQQRLLLETCWDSIEYAGYNPSGFNGELGGVFVGAGPNEYGQQAITSGDPAIINAYLGTGNSLSIAAGRIAYVLGWQGPCSAVDTACSSSLVAIHLACQSLKLGESNIALAGGVNLTLSPLTNITLSRAQMLSPEGRCKTFDASADGYVRSEGCGIVFLKRLSDAVADNDNILGVIRGSAINQDGRSQGLTAPNGPAQETVIKTALKRARVNANQIDYVEAHGTGTALGDPIEMRSINAIYGKSSQRDNRLMIGSVKTNIGHTEVAAGIAGLIKVVLSMKNGQVPPHLHLDEISPVLDFDSGYSAIPTELTDWKSNGGKRLAGISSFGFSGTNAHLILEQGPRQKSTFNDVDRSHHVLTLSAKNESALKAQVDNFLRLAVKNPKMSLADICYTANNGRHHFSSRAAFVADSMDNLVTNLSGFSTESLSKSKKKNGKTVFLFSGQGSQYADMGKTLYQTHPPFRQWMNQCEEILEAHLEHSLLSVLWGENDDLLNQTEYTQPALFAIEYSLAMLWRTWGISPDLVMGHSVGEYAAACIAGAYSLQDGLKMIAARGRLMQALPDDGSMLAVMAEENDLTPILAQYANQISIAAYNSPIQIVLSGEKSALDAINQTLTTQGIQTHPLDVSHAFHSALMEPMMEEYQQVVNSVQFKKPRLGVISNLTGALTKQELCDPDHWVQHVRKPVRFVQGMESLAKLECSVFIEVGPKPTLLSMARSCAADLDALWLPTLRPGQDEWKQCLSSLAEIYANGLNPDWQCFDASYQRKRLILPTYPFQRERFWLGGDGTGFVTPVKRYQFPMLGERMRLPGSKTIRFETLYTTTSPAYLSDHKLFGVVVVPGASHVSTMISAAKAAYNASQCSVQDVCFLQPLVLTDDEPRNVQLVLEPRGDDVAYAELMSSEFDANADDIDAWVIHATGDIHYQMETEPTDAEIPWDDVKSTWVKHVSGEDFYQMFSDVGYNLGESFQWLGDGYFNGPQALRELKWPKLPDSFRDYQLYPSLIDALFQIGASCTEHADEIFDTSINEIYVPFAIHDFQLHRTPEVGENLWFYCAIKPEEINGSGTITNDMCLFDSDNNIVAQAIGFQSRKVSQSALQQGLTKDVINDWFYEINWHARTNDQAAKLITSNIVPINQSIDPLKVIDNKLDEPQPTWLVLRNENSRDHYFINRLVKKLSAENTRVINVFPGDSLTEVNSHEYCVPMDSNEDIKALLETVVPDGKHCAGVLNFFGIDDTLGGSELNSLNQELKNSCDSSLQWVKALSTMPWDQPARLWLFSANAHAIENAQALTHLSQSAVWGLGRVISMEHPELACCRIDLDLQSSNDASLLDVRLLVKELLQPDAEDQLAIRHGVRYVARLETVSEGESVSRDGSHAIPDSGVYKVTVPADGILDNINIVPCDHEVLEPNEVEVRVRATGLNFRDVLNALGMFKEFAEREGITLKTFPLGFDLAGEITAIGCDVEHLKIGDRVVGAAVGCLASHVVTYSNAVVKLPDNLNFAEAAAVPTVFLTVYHGLLNLAQLKKGDRILIHACAGGVGLAALQVAQQVGAEVFATASQGKWEFLHEQGVQHVMNSRTLEFADQIMALTDGKGVDVVLNSINGECIPKSIDLLSKGGRFVEIGKIDVWDQQQVEQRRPDVDYHLFDLTDTLINDPNILSAYLSEIVEHFSNGKLKPLPMQVFPMENVSAGFRHLAQARNIGKVVITGSEDRKPQSGIALNDQHSYLITGGLGALGLKVAESLIGKGAEHIILTSRRHPDEALQQQIQALGAQVTVINADISAYDEVEQLLNTIQANHPPLAGIVHAAGVLDDGMIGFMDWSRFEKVMAPKVNGALHLHNLTQHKFQHSPLEFFISFSSIASLLGSPGQSNYAVANAFLDGLMHHRRAQGLPGTSINWGPWAEIGMAAAAQVEDKFSGSFGINALTPDKAIEAFERVLKDNPVQIGIAAFEWDKIVTHLGFDKPPAYLSHIQMKKSSASDSDIKKMAEELMASLEEVPPSERQDILIDTMCEQLARVMGYDRPDQIDPHKPLQELGLDSLMAVEMRNVINGFSGRSLPATLLFKYPTLHELSGYLTTELFPDHEEELRLEMSQDLDDDYDDDHDNHDDAPEIEDDADSSQSDEREQQANTDLQSEAAVGANVSGIEQLSTDDAADLLAKKLRDLKGEAG